MKRFLLTASCAFLSLGLLTSCQKEEDSALKLAQDLTATLKNVTDYESAEASVERVKALNTRLQRSLARPFAFNVSGSSFLRSSNGDAENKEGAKLEEALRALGKEVGRVAASLPVLKYSDEGIDRHSFEVLVGAANYGAYGVGKFKLSELPTPEDLPKPSKKDPGLQASIQAKYDAFQGRIDEGAGVDPVKTAEFNPYRTANPAISDRTARGKDKGKAETTLCYVAARHMNGESEKNENPFSKGAPVCYGCTELAEALDIKGNKVESSSIGLFKWDTSDDVVVTPAAEDKKHTEAIFDDAPDAPATPAPAASSDDEESDSSSSDDDSSSSDGDDSSSSDDDSSSSDDDDSSSSDDDGDSDSDSDDSATGGLDDLDFDI